MNKTTEALKLSEKACFAGKECEALLAKLCVKLGMPDIASEFLDPGVFDRAITALREALDHIPDATKMVALTTEQAQQIEEAFVTFTSLYFEERHRKVATKALATIRAARAQEQEPVAKLTSFHGGKITFLNENQEYLRQGTLFYAAPVNQEPVAKYMGHRLTPEGTKEFWGYADKPLPERTNLYAAPVHTKDLTDDEILVIANMWEDEVDELDFARAVIAAYKEKNK